MTRALSPSREFNRYFVRAAARPHARLRLACFPHAGGSAAMFHSWSDRLPPEIEVISALPPGRDQRRHEPFATSLGQIVNEYYGVLCGTNDVPLALFGHSLGALIAYEIACRLEQVRAPLVHLLAGGRRAPQLSLLRSPM